MSYRNTKMNDETKNIEKKTPKLQSEILLIKLPDSRNYYPLNSIERVPNIKLYLVLDFV